MYNPLAVKALSILLYSS